MNKIKKMEGKMKGKRFKGTCAMVFSVFLFVISVATTQAGEGNDGKVKICHLSSDSDVGKVLTVSENATKAHVKHGDPVTFIAYEDGSCRKYDPRRRR